jgi:hypothetical protein
MQSSTYIEDIYLEVFKKVIASQAAGFDLNPAFNFYSILESNKAVTQAQADYIIRLLSKYQPYALKAGIDYTANLLNPQWKSPFRVIDQSKRIHVEKDEQGIPWMCLKFPFQLKKEFDEDIDYIDGTSDSSRWDADRKLRMLSLYAFNALHIYDFVKKHNFIIDDSFLTAIGEVEEIWQQEDHIVPCCFIQDGKVVINNVSNEVRDWWNVHANGVIENDLLLAKSMRFKFRGEATTLVERMAASTATSFWIKDIQQFLELCDKIQGQIVIILDRAYDPREWVKSLIADVEKSNFNKSDIKVCFRLHKEQDNGFNEWVKVNGLGGTVDQGKILIFDNKPAKWLFKQEYDVKLLVTNNLYPHTQSLTRDWLHSHACVIYLGDIKPTLFKDQDIVNL